MKRGTNLLESAAASLLGQVAPLVVALVTMPMVLEGLGEARFGILAIVWAVLGHFSMFDLGFGRAATRSAAAALGRGESGSVPGILGSACLAQLFLGVVGGGLVLMLAPWLAERVLQMEAGPEQTAVLVDAARASLALIGLSVPLVLLEGTLRGGLEAHQQFGRINAVKVPVSVAGLLVPLFGALLGAELATIVALLVAVRLVGLIGYRRQLARLAGLEGWALRPCKSALRELWAFGSWAAVSSAAGPALGYLERFLIGGMLSVSALAFYAVPMEALSRLLVLPSSLAAALFPALSEAAACSRERLASLYLDPMRILLQLLLPLAIVGCALAELGLELWIGVEFAERSGTLTRVLIAVVLLNALSIVPFSVVQGLGRPSWKARLDLVELPLFGLAAWMLIGSHGLLGAALAKLLVTVIDFVALNLFAMRLTRVSLRQWCLKLLTPVFIPGAALALLALSPAGRPESVGALAGTAALIAGLLAAYLYGWGRGLEKSERQACIALIKSFLARASTKREVATS